MLAKYAIAGFAGSALLTSVAFGQTPTVTTDSNTDKATTATTASPVDMASMKGNWRTSKLVGLSVYNDNNESLGSINDLLTDKNGDIKAVVLGVGGFLGVGEHLVAVPFDKVKFVNEPVAYTSAAGAPNAGAAKTTSTTTSTTTTGAATTSATTAKANPWYPDHAVYSGTKDQLKAMTQFKYSTD
jgi:sporulation protein YlmC with PRC-barrel domain